MRLTPTEIQDAVVFEHLEAFLADHGAADHENQSTEVFDELETAQVGTVKKQFQQDIRTLKSRTKCFKCHHLGQWSKDCPSRSNRAAKSRSSQPVSSAAVVEEGQNLSPEVMLVSPPGFGIVDSGRSRTLISQDTLSQFMRMNQAKCMPEPTGRKECN